MEKMDRKLKAEWCAALRSGEYKQGQAMLHDPVENTYCCLGVLGHIMGVSASELDSNAYLRSDMGIEVPIVMGTQETLAGMNDGHKGALKVRPQPFTEIADWIEKEL